MTLAVLLVFLRCYSQEILQNNMWSILALALIIRLPLLSSSLWLDESIQALALMGKMGPLLTYALADFQPPIYHFILSAWTSLAGFSEIALRTPSLLAGLGTVYMGVKLGNLLGGKKLGQILGLLIATNPLLIYYSAEGRTYMMTTFFVTASFYYLLTLLRSKKVSKNTTIYYLITTSLALWSSYLAWIIIFLQLIYLVYKKNWRLAKLTLITLFSLILWLPSLINSLGIGLSTMTNSPEWGRVVGGISGKAIALTWVKAVIGRISFANKYLYAGIVSALAAFHIFILSRARRYTPLLPYSIIITIVVASLISLVIPVYSYFRLLFLVPLYLTLIALGLSRSRAIFAKIILFLNLIFIAIFFFTPSFQHEDWRSMTKFLNTKEGIVAMPSLAQNAPLTYYELILPLTEIKSNEQLTSDHIYYVRYVEDLFDPAMLGRKNLQDHNYTLTNEFTYPGLVLEHYEAN